MKHATTISVLSKLFHVKQFPVLVILNNDVSCETFNL